MKGVGKILYLLFLYTGIYGILFYFYEIPELIFQEWLVSLLAVLPGILLWMTYQKKKTWFPWVFGGMFILTLGWMAFSGNTCLMQFQMIGKGLLGTVSQSVDVTEGMICLAFLLTYLIFLLEILLRSHWFMYVITTLLLLAGPLLGIYPGISSVLLLVVFQFAFWGIHSVRKLGRKWNINQGANLTGQIGKIILSGTAAIFAFSLLFSRIGEEWFYQAAYEAEGVVQKTVKSLVGTINDPDRGTVSRGNLYPTGEEQLVLWTTDKPTETVYLKGFTGGDYSLGQWQDDPSDQVFQNMDENSLHWGRWASWAESMFQSMYYVINGSIQMKPYDFGREMYVRNVNDASDTWYIPYYSTWGRQGVSQHAEGDYHFYYFQQNEMDIDWDNISPQYMDTAQMYKEIQDAYVKEAKVMYTRVPKDSVPRLVELCDKNPMDSVEEITAFIQTTLQEQAVYSQTPGLFPFNEDPVEYFLFDGKEGYCQHFASAAVLMYRLYGVPARYATGYAVSPEDFEEESGGTYQASVTDSSAHAWPEIFIQNQGWTPVEVTPGSIDIVTSNAGLDSELLSQALENHKWDLSVFGRQTPDTQEGESGNFAGKSFRENSPETWEIITFIFLLFLLILGGVSLNRWYQIQRLHRMGASQLLRKMVGGVHFCGILRELDGDEEIFYRKLAEQITDLGSQGVKDLVNLANQEAFGVEPLKSSELRKIRKIYNFVMKSLEGRLSWIRKILFRYVYVYL